MNAPTETLRALLDALPEDLARQALTHSSWVEDRGRSYERLAFLGDSVLSLAVSTALYPRFQSFGAGRLTKLRAHAVAEGACVAVAEELGLPDRLRARAPGDRGKLVTAPIASDRVVASVCEAVIGACYLAFGFERVAAAVAEAFAGQVADALERPIDHKSALQEWLARRAEVVGYRIETEEGPAHDRRFVAIAQVGGEEIGRGEGTTKKGAEQAAAARALDRLAGRA